jgi:hypothetical protein
MKSMETYYRWLAIQYAAQCGRIHSELVETLFRYNARPRMGRFVARLEALCRRVPGDNAAVYSASNGSNKGALKGIDLTVPFTPE